MAPPELEVREVSSWYGSVQALRGVSLSVNKGECVAIVGANGAGKTTLLRAMSRLVPYDGEISLAGTPVAGSPERVVRSGLGHVLEGRRIFTGMTVKDNLLLARFGGSREGFEERFEAVLELFPVLRDNLRRFGGELSGGQQQILAVGRGLLTAPRVLLFDEPSLGVAPVVIEQLARAIPVIRREWNITLVIADQSTALAESVASRAYVLQGGRVAQELSISSGTHLGAELHSAYFGLDST